MAPTMRRGSGEGGRIRSIVMATLIRDDLHHLVNGFATVIVGFRTIARS